MKPLELLNKRFTKLLVVKDIDRGKQLKWLCRCDCGKEIITRGADLNRGFIKSCGCWNSQVLVKRNTTHNLSTTRFYKIWQAIKNRCLNKKSSRYSYYGGRGIKICKRWLKFENFYKDMYEQYLEHCRVFGIKNTSIDRINNNGDYKLTNCRWATQKEQVNNSRIVLCKKN